MLFLDVDLPLPSPSDIDIHKTECSGYEVLDMGHGLPVTIPYQVIWVGWSWGKECMGWDWTLSVLAGLELTSH